jgi:putative addiction module component (TIGR02574 family)
MKGDDLLATALALPPGERARIAHELLVSLDDGEDSDVAGAWLAEIERRAREVTEGTAVLEEWSAVRERLAARAIERRSR